MMTPVPIHQASPSFAQHYTHLLNRFVRGWGIETGTNERTGADIHFIPEGLTMNFLVEHLLPTISARRTFPRTAAVEAMWVLSGSPSLDRLHQHNVHIWDEFTDEEGVCPTAYGWRYRNYFHRDQLKMAVEHLADQPTSRQVWISAWDPGRDGLGDDPLPNFPCPVGFNVHRSKEGIHSTLVMRSSDIFVGLPYDVMGHAYLLAAIAASIDPELDVVSMQVVLAHPHLYDCHMDMARQALVEEQIYLRTAMSPWIKLPRWNTQRIVRYHKTYIGVVEQELRRVNTWPSYHCKPEVVL